MPEIVDVVDSEDTVVGERPVSDVHAEGELHRGSGVLAFRTSEYDEVLLQIPGPEKPLSGRHLPGGHLRSGETYKEGARREFAEEMYADGVSAVEGLDFMEAFKILKSADGCRGFLQMYVTVDPGPFSPDPEEVEEYRFDPLKRVHTDILQGEDPSQEYTETAVTVFEECWDRFGYDIASGL